MAGDAGEALRGRLLDAPAAAAVLQRLPALAGQPLELEVLQGGLTNRNYRVRTGAGDEYVARFSSAKSTLLSIDRHAEHHDAKLAAAAGVGPRVVDFAPDDGVLLVEWINGRTFTEADLDDEEQLARVAALCRRLHAAAAFHADFDIFRLRRHYLAVVHESGFRLPEDYESFAPQAEVVERVLRASASSSVPCHNDLLAANMIDDGRRLWFIDFEYAGNNDPCFELGNIWSEAGLPPERLEQLVTSYGGSPSPVQTARARLFALMAQYTWTLWASIQDAVSDVDFDFWQWGLERYTRARAQFRDPALHDLITTVRESVRHQGAEQWPTPSI